MNVTVSHLTLTAFPVCSKDKTFDLLLCTVEQVVSVLSSLRNARDSVKYYERETSSFSRQGISVVSRLRSARDGVSTRDRDSYA